MSKRRIVVLDAPSNLGLRPPETGALPGCYKLPWALRDRKLLQAIEATDAGVIIPPRYRAEWQPGQGDRNAEAIALFSIALADRVCALVEQQAAVQALGTVASATQAFGFISMSTWWIPRKWLPSIAPSQMVCHSAR